jgi:hypothetical protein
MFCCSIRNMPLSTSSAIQARALEYYGQALPIRREVGDRAQEAG